MGLRDDLSADIAAAFDSDLADAVRPFTASHPGQSAYDPSTGTMTATDEPYTGRGVFSGYRLDQIDGALIQSTDLQLLALQSEVTRAPEMGDTLDGMQVVRVSQDPAGATWSVQLRK
jgi:hypothetical protein